MTKEALIAGLLFLPLSSLMAQDIDSDWGDDQATTIKEMTEKHGDPTAETPSMVVWENPKGDFEEIIIYRDKVDHDFPMPHQDFLEQSVYLNVPAEKMDELSQFDGSIIVYRTEGRLAVRCDNESANYLALNLVHDIITDRKSVDEAREAYAAAIQQMLDGDMPEIMKSLTFTSMDPSAASFADVAVLESQPGGQRQVTGAGQSSSQRPADRSAQQNSDSHQAEQQGQTSDRQRDQNGRQ